MSSGIWNYIKQKYIFGFHVHHAAFSQDILVQVLPMAQVQQFFIGRGLEGFVLLHRLDFFGIVIVGFVDARRN